MKRIQTIMLHGRKYLVGLCYIFVQINCVWLYYNKELTRI